MTYDPIAAKRARLQREIRDAQTQLDALELIPSTDTYGDGTVIKAEISWRGGAPLTYIFLKIVDDTLREGDRWYHTGFIDHGGAQHHSKQFFKGWDAFQKWMAETGRVVETWCVLEIRRESAEVPFPDPSPITHSAY